MPTERPIRNNKITASADIKKMQLLLNARDGTDNEDFCKNLNLAVTQSKIVFI